MIYMMNKKLIVNIPNGLNDDLENKANAMMTSKSAVIRLALVEYIK